MLIFDRRWETYQVEGYKQFDTSEPLQARFLYNSQPVNLANYTIRFECLKPDGHIVVQDTGFTIKNTNELSLMLDKQVTVVDGILKCQFVFLTKADNKQHSTFVFYMDVQKSALNIETHSDSVVTITETLNTRINEAVRIANNLVTANRTATNTNKTLTNTNKIANQTNATLLATNKTATNTNTTLIATNKTANATNTTLTETNRVANVTNTNLKTTTNTANNTNTTLGETVTRAVNANKTLGATNQTATTKKTELDQSIANAEKVMGGGTKVEDFTGSSIPNLTETKARIKVGSNYKMPITRDDAVFVATNKTLKTKISEMDTSINARFPKSGGTISGSISVGGNIVNTTGNIQSNAGSITAQTGIISKTGNIIATAGEVRASSNIVSTKGNIVASAGEVRASSNIVSTKGNITASGGNIVAVEGNVSAKGNITSTTGNIVASRGKVSASGDIVSTTGNITTSKGSFWAKNTITAENYIATPRLVGYPNNEILKLGSGNCRIDVTNNYLRLFSTTGSDNGIVISSNGGIDFKAGNVTKHSFSATGSKSGGSMEIDGTVYGMSPTDSPQTLIEYIIPNVKVENEKRLDLDPIYVKMVSYYVAFLSSRHMDIKEKGTNYIILSGNGVTDILIKGQRKGAEDYFRIMGGIHHGEPKEIEPKIEVDSLITEEDIVIEESNEVATNEVVNEEVVTNEETSEVVNEENKEMASEIANEETI